MHACVQKSEHLPLNCFSSAMLYSDYSRSKTENLAESVACDWPTDQPTNQSNDRPTDNPIDRRNDKRTDLRCPTQQSMESRACDLKKSWKTLLVCDSGFAGRTKKNDLGTEIQRFSKSVVIGKQKK